MSDSTLCVSVVTGASEGIGRAYAEAVSDCLNSTDCVCLGDEAGTPTAKNVSAELLLFNPPANCGFIPSLYPFIFYQLAERGLNVVIMSRTKEKLDQLAEEIGIKPHVFYL